MDYDYASHSRILAGLAYAAWACAVALCLTAFVFCAPISGV